MAKNDLVRVVVAPGKCIQIPHPTQALVRNDKGQPFIGPKATIMPGDIFECEREEAARLKRLGVVLTPDGQAAPKPLFGMSEVQDQKIGAG